MIGVLAKNEDIPLVGELFELFKTPWELCREEKDYDVLICTVSGRKVPKCRLAVFYGQASADATCDEGAARLVPEVPGELVWKDLVLPVYTGFSTLDEAGEIFLTTSRTGMAVGIVQEEKGRKSVRIGYDLFQEVDYLLNTGQAPRYGSVPSLEIHIAILRDLLVGYGLPFIEVAPVPFGCDMIACLTHDVDFSGIRNHGFDHTLLGFLYRATWKSFVDALRKRASWERLGKNLKAVLSLPAVYAGITPDFWIQFDGYLEIEKGLNPTFFFLPFKGVPGRTGLESAPRRRAGVYDVQDQLPYMNNIISAGGEVGLHGIDIWHDAAEGMKEVVRIASVSGNPVHGVRTHWLYSNSESPRLIEAAGAVYDSTVGFNDAVGFRAGTAQAFRPRCCERLLELPLLVQDTALFYPRRMGLNDDQAWPFCSSIMAKVAEFGGAFVVNWHERSLAPERQWGRFYARLLEELRSRRTWFATGHEACQWFLKRRSLRFRRTLGKQLNPDVGLRSTREVPPFRLSLKVYNCRIADDPFET